MQIPDTFVHIKEFIPEIIQEIRFAGPLNFTGAPVPFYRQSVAVVARETAKALRSAFHEAERKGYWIKVWDAYRPQPAVDSFMTWVKSYDDLYMKALYYPNVEKADLNADDPEHPNYIAPQSEHSRGSALDITLVDRRTHRDLDMGGPYLLFDILSDFHCQSITDAQHENRELLKGIMENHGFEYYEHEWWHYHLVDEPFPDTYFKFPVE